MNIEHHRCRAINRGTDAQCRNLASETLVPDTPSARFCHRHANMVRSGRYAACSDDGGLWRIMRAAR